MVRRSPHRRGIPRASSRGFTYLWVLFAVALLGISLVTASTLWVSTANRQKRVQLEWAGAQFKEAIGSYYESGPGGNKSYPRTFDDLLEDRRFGLPRRHLRRIYFNPFSAMRDWEPVQCGFEGICGFKTNSSGEVPMPAFVYVPDTVTRTHDLTPKTTHLNNK